MAEIEPAGILRGEWLNARGAIARFERSAIELRLSDTQECPQADVAVAWALSSVVRALTEERWASAAEQRGFSTERLAALLVATTEHGPAAPLGDPGYVRALGWRGPGGPTAGELWQALIEDTVASDARTSTELLRPLQVITRHGTLSQRILAALGDHPSRSRMQTVYHELCDCLAQGRLFHGLA